MTLLNPSADASPSIEATSGPGLLIDLALVKDRLGPSWVEKQDRLLQKALEYVAQQSGPSATAKRAGDSALFVTYPECSERQCQALLVRATADLLRLFLGDNSVSTINISVIEPDEAGPFSAKRISEERVKALLTEARQILEKRALKRSFALRTTRGLPIRMDLTLHPVCLLAEGGRAVAHEVRRSLTAEGTGKELSPADVRGLSLSDVGDLDCKVLEGALEWCDDNKNLGSLVVSTSYVALNSSSVRSRLFGALDARRDACAKGLVCEVTRLDPCVPPLRLADLVSLARAQYRGVTCRFPINLPIPLDAAKLGAAPSVESASGGDVSERDIANASQLRFAAQQGQPILAHRVPVALVEVVKLLGVTHYTESEAERWAGSVDPLRQAA